MSSDNITSEEVGGHAGTSDLINLEGGAVETETTTTNIPDSSRSYSGPTMYQNRWTILCSFTLLVLVGVAIGLSVVSVERSDEALALAQQSVEAGKEMQTELRESNQAVVDAVEGWEQRPAPAPAEPAAPIGTPSPTSKPTSEPTTRAPVTPSPTYAPSESHPLNPRWYHTSHKDYEFFQDMQSTANPAEEAMQPWLLSNMFCREQSLEPCEYDAYCPNGKGGQPYHGGPPKSQGWEDRKEEQWSPLLVEGTFPWVQVGTVPEEEGGKDGSRCVTWEDFEYGNGANIMEVRGEPYMQWVLCCEKPEDGEKP